jgi:hypothetical protein
MIIVGIAPPPVPSVVLLRQMSRTNVPWGGEARRRARVFGAERRFDREQVGRAVYVALTPPND